MSVVVFLGPSLERPVAENILPATYLPPVSMGDVYSVARRRPRAIAIIDGYFDRVPAVWHKEILWALSRGVQVFGASSMGALRAAELDAFGMVGIGRVYEAYRDSVIEDDDEVALMHAPSEFGYAAGSEAMVNMRATFAAARDEAVITPATHDRMVAIAKADFYGERNYDRTLALTEEQGVPPDECTAMRAWLVTGRRDAKRADAIELLTHVAALSGETEQKPTRAPFTFHVTSMWDDLRRSVDQRPLTNTPGVETGLDDDALDELRLEGAAYIRERDHSLTRMLAIELGSQLGVVPAPLAQHLAADAIRETYGLESRDALDAWLRDQHLTNAGVQSLIEDEAQAQGVLSTYRTLLPLYLRDQLRMTGRYAELTQRAHDKQQSLWRKRLHNPGLAEAGVTDGALWAWFFGEVLQREMPADLDAAAQELDFPSVDLMRRVALRELLYRRLTEPQATANTGKSPVAEVAP